MPQGSRPSNSDDLPKFPFEPEEIKTSRFRVIEPSDMRTRDDVETLMRLMWNERECAFFYYVPQGGTASAVVAEACNNGELLMNKMARRYYRHPRFHRDYVHIPERNGSYFWPWEKEVVEKGPEYWQVQLQLSVRKITELDISYKLQLEQRHFGQQRTASKLARTVQPIHFEDFSGRQFERLVFAYQLRIENWRTLEWYGQSGSDLGRDIWAERQTGRSLCIQCANRKRVTASKIMHDIDQIVRARRGVPDNFLVVCACGVSAKLRDKVKEHAQKKGIMQCDLWSGDEFEERLRRDAESILKRFVDGVEFPDTSEELRRFIDLEAAEVGAVVEAPQTVHVVGLNNSGIIANHVTIRNARPRQQVIILPGSIGSNPLKYNYIEYLIKRLTTFRESGSSFGQRRHSRVHPGSTRRILEKQLGGLPKDLPLGRFADVVTLLKTKIDDTALGRKNRKRNVDNYHNFEEHAVFEA